jgi:hypothetical protein
LQVKPYLLEGTELVRSLVQFDGAYPNAGDGSTLKVPVRNMVKGASSLGSLVITGKCPSHTRCHGVK